MASGKPSMMALLGLLAVAGFKHRDKLSDMLASARGDGADVPASGGSVSHDAVRQESESKSGSLLTELASMFGGSSAGSTLANGLTELIDRLKETGRADEADSWVGTGSNRELQQNSLEQTLGEDTIAELSEKTGLSRSVLLSRLSANIPNAVDNYSPAGKLPTEEEAEQYR